jgi:membrane protease YdiL (CAAX protease family)
VNSGRRAAIAELVAIGCIGAWNFGRARVGNRVRISATLAAAGAVLGVARAGGARASELGLSPASAARSARLGARAATPIALAVAAVVAIPRTRRLLHDEKISATSPGEAAFETFVRIPLETAVAEELIFRGALLALGTRARSRPSAIVTSSLCFGAWHVVPTLGSLARGAGTEAWPGPASTVAVVTATSVAGLGFALLRVRSDSVVAPIIVHATLNMVAFAGIRATAGRRPLQPGDPVAQQREREQHDDHRGHRAPVADQPVANLVQDADRPAGRDEEQNDRDQQRQ